MPYNEYAQFCCSLRRRISLGIGESIFAVISSLSTCRGSSHYYAAVLIPRYTRLSSNAYSFSRSGLGLVRLGFALRSAVGKYRNRMAAYYVPTMPTSSLMFLYAFYHVSVQIIQMFLLCHIKTKNVICYASWFCGSVSVISNVGKRM